MSVRFRMRDGAPQGSRAVGRVVVGRMARTRDLAEKKLVASYNGAHFVAEREGEQLLIYAVGEDGVPGVRTQTSDAAAVSAGAMMRKQVSTMNSASADFWSQHSAAQRRALGVS